MIRSIVLRCALLAATTACPAKVSWSHILRQPTAWYATDEARTIADNVLLFQTESGGWPKNVDETTPPTAEFIAATAADHRWPTIDNDATTTEIRFLAQVTTATPKPAYTQAALRGIDYLLVAQSPSGGWPQFFPLRDGYYQHITFNDDATVNVLNVLRAIAQNAPTYQFVDDDRRPRAAAAVERGIACILKTQVVQSGKLTGWCAQHDQATLAPAWARNFEPPSLSGNESVGVVRFLMGIEKPSPAVVASIDSAVTWLQSASVSGLRIDNTPGADGKKDRHAIADPAAPKLWARFYELETHRPIFIGRDRVIRYDFNEIERERRTGYAYLGTWPADLLSKDYPRWKAKQPKS
ncbi:MAG: pectate lyase [Opitutus sp.]